MKKVSFIAIGSELLKGYIPESNGYWFWQQIRGTDWHARQELILADDLELMTQAIREQAEQADIVVISGGLGPTDDDLTREAIAAATDCELVFEEEAWEDVQAIFKKRGKNPGDSNRKQALKPQGGKLLKNDWGTAPAIEHKSANSTIYAFPGVPSELKQLMKKYILDDLNKHSDDRILKLHGIGESSLMDIILSEELIPKDLSWGTMARKDGIHLRLDHQAIQHKEYTNTLNKLNEKLSEYIYCDNGSTPQDILVQKLEKHSLSFVCAESCTGGMLGQWMTARSGSSSYFNGGIIAYQNEIKQSVLGVSQEILESKGAVSVECALAMAKGALKTMKSDLAVGITGIAGPGGGSEEKPVGTVCIAAAHRDGGESSHCYSLTGNRDDIRERSCHTAILDAIKLIRE